jgi:hypothetical protein
MMIILCHAECRKYISKNLDLSSRHTHVEYTYCEIYKYIWQPDVRLLVATLYPTQSK